MTFPQKCDRHYSQFEVAEYSVTEWVLDRLVVEERADPEARCSMALPAAWDSALQEVWFQASATSAFGLGWDRTARRVARRDLGEDPAAVNFHARLALAVAVWAASPDLALEFVQELPNSVSSVFEIRRMDQRDEAVVWVSEQGLARLEPMDVVSGGTGFHQTDHPAFVGYLRDGSEPESNELEPVARDVDGFASAIVLSCRTRVASCPIQANRSTSGWLPMDQRNHVGFAGLERLLADQNSSCYAVQIESDDRRRHLAALAR